MFAESILQTSWAQRTQRSWTTLTSFGLQVIVIAALLAIPLWRTVGLPGGRVLQPPVTWGPPAPLRPIVREHVPRFNQSNLSDNVLIAPPSIPPNIKMIDEVGPPPQVSYSTPPEWMAGLQQAQVTVSGRLSVKLSTVCRQFRRNPRRLNPLSDHPACCRVT